MYFNISCRSKDINLKSILTYKKRYNCEIGYSDHSIGSEFAIASIALGSVLVEKHFTINSEKNCRFVLFYKSGSFKKYFKWN